MNVKGLVVTVIIFLFLFCCSNNEEKKESQKLLITVPSIEETHLPPPPGFVDLKEYIPTIRLDIRYATINNFVGEILDGYEALRAFALPEVAEVLALVQQELILMGYSLKIYDAYRPMQAEQHMIDWALKNSKEHLMYEGYIPGVIYPERQFGHSCGNAIDLTIVDAMGRELDMGTDFDHFSELSWTLNAQGEVLENRLLLKRLMEKYGFSNFDREWWHYNYFLQPGPARDDVIR